MNITIFDVYRPVMRHFRRRRHQWFAAQLQPRPSDRLLDVGGFPAFWLDAPPVVGAIDCLNICQVPWEPESAKPYNITTRVGDGCALDLPDGCYDIAFSNSVIEHVGSWERQQEFARQIRRVGRRLWVQTPAYECPIEPHYIAPAVHWLRPGIQKRLLRFFTPWGILQRPTPQQIDEAVATTRLLKRKEMEALFPDCTILTEWLVKGIPKSYVAVRS